MPVNSVGKKKFLILAVAILLVATTAIYSSGAEVVNTPRTAWVSHTEYEAGDVASTIVRITDYRGNPYSITGCVASIYYPNKTAYLTNRTMSQSTIAGNWYANDTAPSIAGTYEQQVYCNYTGGSIATSQSFHVTPALTFIRTVDADVLAVGANLSSVNATLTGQLASTNSSITTRVSSAETTLSNLLSSVNASLNEQVRSKAAEANNPLNTSLTAIRATIVATIADSNTTIHANVDSTRGNITTLLNNVNSTLIARLNEVNATQTSQLNAVNASVSAYITSALQNITTTIENARLNLTNLSNAINATTIARLNELNASTANEIIAANLSIQARIGASQDTITTQLTATNLSLSTQLTETKTTLYDFILTGRDNLSAQAAANFASLSSSASLIYNDTRWLTQHALNEQNLSEIRQRFVNIDGNLSAIESFCGTSLTNSSVLCQQAYSTKAVLDTFRATQENYSAFTANETAAIYALLIGDFATNINTLLTNVGIIKGQTTQINATVESIRQTQTQEIDIRIIS